MVNLTVRIDDNLKAEAEKVLARLGLTTSDAVRLFFAQIRNTRSIPFPLKVYDEPNEKLENIITETENEYRKGNLQSFTTVDDLVKYLDE